ncbi:hypothetical protein MTR67_034647 [Solanum verrucosum]|uniref:Uncharacterized protein n=1 Tax=Solanum verrucosum TaxID=315347 RepID=A0AAF0U8J4_SOLVR|nr:hypothetical protein MTR67_034647 [Solanum verrucosum]
MGSGCKAVNAVETNSFINPNEAHFEAMYNEEVYFLTNQTGVYPPNNPRSGGNQGSNIDRDDGWRDRDREWRDRSVNWTDRDGDKDCYVPLLIGDYQT